jgi:glycerol-3-phosphate cytidylyltransferase
MIIGFTCGVFDLFHPGHVLMLKECKQHCDRLIVALNKAENISAEINPGKRKPLYTFEERLIIMESCRYVDEVIGYNSEDELYQMLKTKKIDIRFLGDDYIGKLITGNDLGVELHFIDRSHGYSSTAILNRLRKFSS